MAVGLTTIAGRLRAFVGAFGMTSTRMQTQTPNAPGRTSRRSPAVAPDVRRDVEALLAWVEEWRPGLARNRALAMAHSELVRALEQHFTEVEHVTAGDATTAVAEETIDFVYATVDSPAAAIGLIPVALRALRLLGVAAVDVRPDERSLEAVVSIGEWREGSSELSLTITNIGLRAIGSAVMPLRVEARAEGPDGFWRVVGVASIESTVFPACSVELRLPIGVALAEGSRVLELSVVSVDGWHERRSSATAFSAGGPADADRPTDALGTAMGVLDESVVAAAAAAGGQVIGVRSGVGELHARRYLLARA